MSTSPKFHNADGSITMYSLACGNVQRTHVVDRFAVTLSKDGCYHIKVSDRKLDLGWRLPPVDRAALYAKVSGELETAIREGLPTADLDGRVANMLMENDTSYWEALGDIIDTVFDPYL